MQSFSDIELLERLRHGDNLAFKAIYDRYWVYVYTIAFRKTKSHEVAEELVQDLFTSFWIRREDVKITQSLRTYLGASIKYLVINYYQALMVRDKYARLQQQAIAPVPDPAQSATDCGELQQNVERGVALLPEKARKVFEMSRFRHLSNREIAASLQISEKAVEYHITRSLKLLRAYLKDFLVSLTMLAVCLGC